MKFAKFRGNQYPIFKSGKKSPLYERHKCLWHHFKWLLDRVRESGERPKHKTRRGKVVALFSPLPSRVLSHKKKEGMLLFGSPSNLIRQHRRQQEDNVQCEQ